LYTTLIFLALAAADLTQETFVFQNAGSRIEGYVVQAPKNPRALILYFHRAIEDRNSVKEWGRLLGPAGYAVAGYTATSSADKMSEVKSAVKSLRSKKQLQSLPLVVMGASMGTRTAAQLFALDPAVKALILIVPGSPEICDYLKKANERPVHLILAEKDEIMGKNAGLLLNCLPNNTKQLTLPGALHRFPPSLVSSDIVDWLNSLNLK